MEGGHYNKLTQKQISLENKTAIKELTNRFDSLEETVSETSNDVKRIIFYFDSDSKTNTEGFIEKNNRHDKEIKQINIYLSEAEIKFKTTAKVTAFFVGGATSVLTWVILNFDKIFGN